MTNSVAINLDMKNRVTGFSGKGSSPVPRTSEIGSLQAGHAFLNAEGEAKNPCPRPKAESETIWGPSRPAKGIDRMDWKLL